MAVDQHVVLLGRSAVGLDVTRKYRDRRRQFRAACDPVRAAEE
jgi:hypothetical protein